MNGLVKLAVCFAAAVAVWIFFGALVGLGAATLLGYAAGTAK